ncbi:Predicted branched-chain amino acid permease (azaleucine resistance) [Jannaschia faecimaris]|uniref:Predicted branched-chain amino acid permease (Azaleucine resistance) n=1 Tax=Jannaschia faecimaris TaxID=1244108 RepID=A0A1H3MWQ1_9RHOB|nr:AzlC family ABC transporter permease [Jannaschia faecimaris]SDY80918.1 Predicted branched-chain amino acid permease (azaleucine resistance) [Jannaschia faecimaris]
MRPPFARGVAEGLPFMVIMVPFGALFGVLGVESGLPLTQVMAFSVLVIAGASQFTAVQLIVDAVPAVIVIFSALAVNLRMVMYSASMVPYLGAAPLWQRALISYIMVDQTYALAQGAFDAEARWTVEDRVAYFAGVALPVFPAWVGSTWAGAVLGTQVPESWQLDFALPLAFVALVGPMLKSRAHLAAALLSVIGALALWWVPYNLGLILAATAGMIVGAEVDRRMTETTA